MAVNLSPAGCATANSSICDEVWGKRRFPPSRVVLEITEGVLIDDPRTAKARLDDLRRLGAARARRFGSGYSSLTYSAEAAVRQAQDRPRVVTRARPLGQSRRDHQAIVALGAARHERTY